MLRYTTFSLAACFFGIATASQAAVTLVKDVNEQTNPVSSSPANIVNVNGIAFFTADDGVHGRELWKSDGTEAGTVLVKDIRPYDASPSPDDLISLNGLVLFTANDGTNGVELWKSDGTETGTMMVKDISPGSGLSSDPLFTKVGNLVLFVANNGTNGNELWKTDGSSMGTVMVKDIRPTSGCEPERLVNVNGTLFFTAYEETHGRALWKSDGTEPGTVLVKDFSSSGYAPHSLTAVGERLYFIANDGTNGFELWKSDGTEAGTMMVTNIAPGSATSNPNNLTDVNGTLYFSTYMGGTALWKSDGTEAGTEMLSGIATLSTRFTDVNGTLYFTESNFGDSLYRSDGTTNGPVLVFSDGLCLRYGGHAWIVPFGFNGSNYLFEVCRAGIWMTDGTPAGTVQLKGFIPAQLVPPVNVNGTLFFSAHDGVHGYELWKSDGSSNDTVMVKDIRAGTLGSAPTHMAELNGSLLLAADDGINGRELWKSDGTADGTAMITNIFYSGNSSAPNNLTAFNGQMFFSADGGTTGIELWQTDGSSSGTALVKDVAPGSPNASPASLVVVSNTLYFSALTSSGRELWKSDGTSNGTVMVKDIVAGGGGSSPANLVDLNGRLFFVATDGTNGVELWTSDGSSNGTVMVRDIVAGSGSSSPANLQNVNGLLFFTATDGTNGVELWRSDGTGAGTALVKDIRTGSSGSNPDNLLDFNGTLFFSAHDGLAGVELWRSDGTSNGTFRVKDIYPGASSSFPANLAVMNGMLFFSASDGANGTELWKSDGTSNGTVMVRDIVSGSGGSSPSDFVSFNGRLFFSANESVHGRELWTSDGTAVGTYLLADITGDPVGSNPTGFTAAGGTLFFSASRLDVGEELLAVFREDFGDAPTNYPTLLADNGARHLIPTGGAKLYLGVVPPDGGLDAHPDATATGDDNNDTADEGGVVLPAYLNSGQTQSVVVEVTGSNGVLNAWVDWNADGDWADANEQIFTNQSVVAGTNNLSFTVPVLSVSGASFARFRLSTASGLSPRGAAPDGEVEDYLVTLNLPPTLSSVTATNVGQKGAFQTSYSFSVTVADDHGIVVSTLDTNDVSVTGPGGALSVILSSESSGSNGSPKTATYTVVPPGGSWNDADNGVYTIGMAGNQVADVGGLFVAANANIAMFTVNMDTTPPVSTITNHPPAQTNSASAVFAFTADDGVGTGVAGFEFSLDGSVFAATTSPKSVSGLIDGSHIFSVRATDLVGNVETNVVSYTWTVDTTPPETEINSGPSTPTNSASAAFTFSGDDGAGTGVTGFEFSLDGGAFSPAGSPLTLTGLSDGSHTFRVRAQDAVGNLDLTPATHTWFIDTTAPQTSITSQPPLLTNGTTAMFEFSGEDGSGVGVVGFETSLDGAAFAPATSPQTLSGLADGAHTFRVRAHDLLGNNDGTPASYTWTVDTLAPDTSIVSHPVNTINVTTASFTFSGDDGVGTGVAGFEHSLDGSTFAATTNPHTVSGLTEGSHTLQVRALDVVGNADATPASYTWRVDLTPPTVSIGSPSATLATLGESVSFAITYGEADNVTLTSGDIILNATGSATATATLSGDGVLGRTMTLTNLNGAGTLGISLAAGTANDLAGNQAPAVGPSATFQMVQPPPSMLAIRELGADSFVITFTGLSNRVYRIEYAGPLLPQTSTTWQTLGTAVVNAQGVGTFTNAPAGEARFYRTIFP